MTCKSKIPLVSVLLPCFNAGQYVKAALVSLVNQTHSNIEIICIDDGSMDSTLDTLEEFSNIDNRIKVYTNSHNLGLIDTLNRAIDIAKGEYIARMDADDISLPDRIERLLCFLEHTASDLVSCDSRKIIDGVIYESPGLKAYSYQEVIVGSFFFNPINHPAILCKSKLLKENKYLKTENTIHCEDYELWNRLLDNGAKIANMELVLYEYRENKNSVSHLYSELQVNNFTILAKNRFARQLKITVDGDLLAYVVNRVSAPKRSTLSKALCLLDNISSSIEKEYKLSPGSGKSVIDKHKLDILLASLLGARSIILKIYICLRLLHIMTKSPKATRYGLRRIVIYFGGKF